MQTLQLSRIQDSERKNCMLEVVSDKYCRAILEIIKSQPKSAIEITNETKIPISTVYRRIQMLHDNKLLVTSGMISEDGKRLFMYKSKIQGMKCNFNEGNVEVELILNN
ncbi:MAG: ArsR family transcriptional regulator [Nitrosopumilus sp.]|uniref:ArsR family transcriptional regulator n=1 Tax=Nitrosopumilus sp. TaxID=2024843 RepID=UPI00247D7122|nr:ArsR family transcriptional regulator [Nitrosopumilus sp.]MCV0392705.1 ArsR family transcriptional regulator [Nitrosopumilus sp.]